MHHFKKKKNQEFSSQRGCTRMFTWAPLWLSTGLGVDPQREGFIISQYVLCEIAVNNQGWVPGQHFRHQGQCQ